MKSQKNEFLVNQRITRRMKKILSKSTKFGEFQAENCAICLNVIEEKAHLPCDHAYCIKCVAIWAKSQKSCPFCRKNFNHVTDFKGKKLQIEQLIENWGQTKEQEKKLRCQFCWADIDDEEMVICYYCRGIYGHARCFPEKELKRWNLWSCEDCFAQEESLLERQQNSKIEEEYRVSNNKMKKKRK